MPFIIKIAAFWLAVALIVWLLRRRPESVLARMAFAWQGPFPLVGEKRSAFYWRKGLFAVGWLLKLVPLASIVVMVVRAVPSLGDSEAVLVVAGMFGAISIGMALLGACLAFIWSAKASLLGPDPAFMMLPKAGGEYGGVIEAQVERCGTWGIKRPRD